ncbi:hypothetical protein [Tenacibaculum caenipelagi]|uniref:Uncharacterized protein n=1 Tax=Tenacibaculum caenipelagi TaxID=1325435 RepID=A0A4R6TF62_9FLAO|nr:hypothetical protein [Tenacibaculum caenipelagi]TDQ23973.1 hypothetical protein DFQ07_2512 [Tenacibaculum caenipelagi]
MKKQILNLGKALNKADQKQINGGGFGSCYQDGWKCCQTTSRGIVFCDAGKCGTYGCFWY